MSTDLLTPRDKNLLLAKILLPLLVSGVGGIVNLVVRPVGVDTDLDVAWPIAGPILAGWSAVKFVGMIGKPPQRSTESMLVGLGAFVPYIFGLFMFGYMGIYSFVRDFSAYWIVFGVIMLGAGFRLLSVYYNVTELARRSDELHKQVQP